MHEWESRVNAWDRRRKQFLNNDLSSHIQEREREREQVIFQVEEGIFGWSLVSLFSPFFLSVQHVKCHVCRASWERMFKNVWVSPILPFLVVLDMFPVGLPRDDSEVFKVSRRECLSAFSCMPCFASSIAVSQHHCLWFKASMGRHACHLSFSCIFGIPAKISMHLFSSPQRWWWPRGLCCYTHATRIFLRYLLCAAVSFVSVLWVFCAVHLCSSPLVFRSLFEVEWVFGNNHLLDTDFIQIKRNTSLILCIWLPSKAVMPQCSFFASFAICVVCRDWLFFFTRK